MKMLGGFNIKTKGEKFRFVSLSATLTRVFVFKQENNIKQRHAQFFNPDDVRLGPDKSIQYIDQRCSNSSKETEKQLLQAVQCFFSHAHEEDKKLEFMLYVKGRICQTRGFTFTLFLHHHVMV